MDSYLYCELEGSKSEVQDCAQISLEGCIRGMLCGVKVGVHQER